MERIDLLSAGGALPWAGPARLLTRLAAMQRALFLILPSHPPPKLRSVTHTLRLCMAAASPPADTCPADTGRDAR